MNSVKQAFIIGVLMVAALVFWHPGRASATGYSGGCFNQSLNVSFSNPSITQGQSETLNVTLYDHPDHSGACADNPSNVFYDLGLKVAGPNENQGSAIWSQFMESGIFGAQAGDNGVPPGGGEWIQSFTIPTSGLQPGTYVADVSFVETSYWPSQGPTYDVSYDNSGNYPFDNLSDSPSWAGSALDYPISPSIQATFTVTTPPTGATLLGYLCSPGGTGCTNTYYASPGQTVEIKAVTEPPGAATQARAYNPTLRLTGSCMGATCLNYTQTVGNQDVWTYDFTAPSSSGSWDIPVNASWQPQYVAPARAMVSLVVSQTPQPNPNPPPPPPPNPTNPPALVVTPSMQTVQVGESTGYWSIFYPNGVGSGSGEFVTQESLWSTNNPSIGTVQPTNGLATGVSNGSIYVTASYDGLTASAVLTVFSPPPPPPPSPTITAEIIDAGNSINGEESAPMPLGQQFGSSPITVWAGGGLILDADTAPANGDSTTQGAESVTVTIPGITTSPVQVPFLQTGYSTSNNQNIKYWDAWDTTTALSLPQSTPAGTYVATFLATWPGGGQASAQLTFYVHAYEKLTGKIYPAGAWSPVAASDGSSGSDVLNAVSGSKIDLRAWDSPQGASSVTAAINGTTLTMSYDQAGSGGGTEEWQYLAWPANLVPGPYPVTFKATWSDGTYKTATVTLDVQPGIQANIYPNSIPMGTSAELTADVSIGATQVVNYNGVNDNPGLQLIMTGPGAQNWTGSTPTDIGPDPIYLSKSTSTNWQVNIPNVTLVPGTYKMPVTATWPGGQTATAWVTFDVTWVQPQVFPTITGQN